MKIEEKQMNDFLRIANARIRKIYPFKAQRNAVAAKMYARWVERNDNLRKLKEKRLNSHDGYQFLYWDQ